MKKILFVFITIALTLVGCTSEMKRMSGNPSEVLDPDTYNELQKKYKSIKNFEEGTAIVKIEKYGLINSEGKELLACEYDTIFGLDTIFRLIVKDSLYGATNIDGKIIKPCNYKHAYNGHCKYLAMQMNDKWGFVNEKGEDITQYKYEDIDDFNDSVFIAKYNGFYGLCDYQQNILIPFKYDRINYKWEKKCPVTVVKIGDSYGLYNSKNEQVLECEYNQFFADSSGYVSLEKDELYGLVEEETGKIMIPFIYKDMGNYSEGLVSAENSEGKCGYLDKKGNTVIPFIYDGAGDFSEGFAAVLKSTGQYMNTIGFGRAPIRKCGYIDKKGNLVIPFKFQQALSIAMCEFHEGLAVQGYSKNNLFATIYGYINKKGDWAIKPIYDEANEFSDGIAQVVSNEKYGYVNKKGVEIIPCKYDKYGGSYVNDSTIRMTKDGKEFYFDLNGRSVRNPE